MKPFGTVTHSADQLARCRESKGHFTYDATGFANIATVKVQVKLPAKL
jgi:hypothetical protein